MRITKIIFALFILNVTYTILSSPVRRQVVAPAWLIGPQKLFVDSRVRVSPKNLQETAAIRASIQKAVQDGKFAVDLNNTDSEATQSRTQMNESELEPEPEPEHINSSTTTRSPIPGLIPFWDLQLPTASPVIGAPSQQDFMGDMQRAWADFVEFTRQMFASSS